MTLVDSEEIITWLRDYSGCCMVNINELIEMFIEDFKEKEGEK